MPMTGAVGQVLNRHWYQPESPKEPEGLRDQAPRADSQRALPPLTPELDDEGQFAFLFATLIARANTSFTVMPNFPA